MRRSLVFALVVPLVVLASPALAQWDPEGSPVCTAPGFQGSLAAVALPSVGWFGYEQSMFALWTDTRSTAALYGAQVHPLGPLGSDGTSLVSPPAYPTFGDACFTGVVPSDVVTNWGVVVAWNDMRTGGQDVYAKRIFEGFDPAWPGDGVAVCTAAGSQFMTRIVGNAEAGATLSWLDQRAGAGNALYAQRLDGAGAPQWAANGIAVCDLAGYRWQHRLAAAPDGGAFFAWTDDHLGSLQVFAMRLLPDGTRAPGWPAGGLPVSAAPSYALGPLVPDGAGGVYVTFHTLAGVPMAARLDGSAVAHAGWPAGGVPLALTVAQGGIDDAIEFGDGLVVVSSRNVSTEPKIVQNDLYVQRLLGDGTRPAGWNADGNRLCPAEGERGNARLAQAPAIIAVWDERRPGGNGDDVYAMRLDADGSPNPQWPETGVPIATGNGRQFSPRPIWDGSSGVMIAYVDDHNFNSMEPDLYAQRVSLSGVVATSVPIGPVGFRLSAPFPNPARHGVTIELAGGRGGEVRAEVLDALGRRVRALDAGAATLRWNLADDAGRRVEPGVYYVRVRGAEGQATRTVVVRR